jgi:hypothetical protein
MTDQWSYHAVANVILAHSLLLSFGDVDKERTAVTGISWGGYMDSYAKTCRLVRGTKHYSIQLRMAHGHIFDFPEFFRSQALAVRRASRLSAGRE